MINISNRRECFFDDYLIDTQKTTAEFRLHNPIRKDIIMTLTKSWEGSAPTYFNMFYDQNKWRMYYLGGEYYDKRGMRVCYAESVDGINWVRPKLNICEWEGSTENNVLLDGRYVCIDNCFVFRDDNPACPPEKKYKAIMYQIKLKPEKKTSLWYFYSADGIHFQKGEKITEEGAFDSLNVVFWDKDAEKYRCYYRSAHTYGQRDTVYNFNEEHIRDIRYIESKDFVNWSKPIMLDFGEVEDVSLYTNQVQKYYRAPHMFIGFPTRYLYRREWTPTYDELCGKQARRERMQKHSRYGLAITDGLFMSSHDGVHFKRYDEAFFRNNIERGKNWIYGDGYCCYGMIETPSSVEGEPNELSLFLVENGWVGPKNLVRYTIRVDGFVSLHAGHKEEVIITKPFVYDGSELLINFATSSWGNMYFTLIDGDGNEYKSYETFGDALDRKVHFKDQQIVKKLSGKSVTLKITLKDGDLYSLKFN